MSNWYVGQEVYCLKNGAGKIISIDKSISYPITAVFKGGCTDTYNIEGYRLCNDATPMLYPAKPEITVPKWQPKPGEWCWFWDEGINGVLLAKFTNITEGKLYRSHGGSVWKYCAPFVGELPEHLKEGQP
jgi:hypothetical protein